VIPRGALEAAARRGSLTAFAGTALRAVRELRGEGYEVALDFQSNFRSSLLARLSGARRRIAQPAPFSKEGARFLATETPPPVEKTVHKIERNLKLLCPLGIFPAAPPRPRIPEPETARLLGEQLLHGGKAPVLLHPGVSAFGAFKAWRIEGYAALARALRAERGSRVLVAWGGDKERAAALRVVELSRGSAELAPRTGSILDLAALLRRSELFVGADSGPLHLAAALGTPVVGLYGPKDPRTYGPYWANASVVRKGVACSPCTLRKCARPECMTLLTADEVKAAALALLPA
jgi:ADP-heptose:LPS heptosyltransferase